MTGPAPIRTARLELIPFRAEAIARLLAGDAPGLARETGLRFPDPLTPPPLLEDVLPLVYQRLLADPGSLGWWTWLAVERDNRFVTGALGFGGPPDQEGSVMIGYATYPGSDRRGYATEATLALVDWALAQPGVRQVCASIPPGNTAARRVAEKVGMRIAGTVWEEEIDQVLLYQKRRASA
ncbi:MAG TPA: GNAT family N-acetyltransferase [Gemmatimonadales bacterium]|nr:GNAT family N-acetyltransferase [Gemmatimonadales bacterium]